ncbi:MAG: hypothetical protein WCI47_03790 [bacterium]
MQPQSFRRERLRTMNTQHMDCSAMTITFSFGFERTFTIDLAAFVVPWHNLLVS